MKLYAITGTYRQGARRGQTFLQGKGGALLDRTIRPRPDELYKTHQAAKAAATRLNRRNELDIKQRPQYFEPIRYTVSEVNF